MEGMMVDKQMDEGTDRVVEKVTMDRQTLVGRRGAWVSVHMDGQTDNQTGSSISMQVPLSSTWYTSPAYYTYGKYWTES